MYIIRFKYYSFNLYLGESGETYAKVEFAIRFRTNEEALDSESLRVFKKNSPSPDYAIFEIIEESQPFIESIMDS